MSKVITANDESFTGVIGNGPALVDFYADWCGPCQMLAPVLDQLAEEYEGRVKVMKVNIDEAPKVTAQFGVRSIPTLLVFKDGVPQDTMIGAKSASELRAFVEGGLKG